MNLNSLAATTLVAATLLGSAGPANLLAQTASQTQARTNEDDISTLKALLSQQQKQIDQLKSALEQQQKLIDRVSNAKPSTAGPPGNDQFALPRDKALGDVASTTPYIPPAAVAPLAKPAVTAAQAAGGAPGNPCEAPPDTNAVPPYLRIGSVCVVPIGFLDATTVWRNENTGSSIGSNFGSVPYNNTVNGRLSEFRFSPQNSRLGFRLDGDWKGAHFIAYNENDFLGTSGSSAITVTNGAFVPRIRLFWVDVRKGKVEFLAGQSWSMLTPNRRGISPFPGDIFYSQVMDTNYMVGLTWTRQPGMRVLFHANDKVTFGFSAEQPDQYIGGSGGGSTVVLPAAFTSLSGTQLDAANQTLAAPTLAPDFIAKIAFDPTARFHGEVTGIERTFKIVNPNTLALGQYSTKAGAGVQVGLNGEIFKGFRLITTNYWSDGGGRYIFGQAPDLGINAAGNLSLLHSGGTVDGFEATMGNWLLFGYYGGAYIARDVIIDVNGSRVGYGYTGSANSQNRDIQEITGGFNETIWRNPRYGAINLIGQYEYLLREPWYVAPNSPKSAHDSAIFFDVRYTLPGAMPNF